MHHDEEMHSTVVVLTEAVLNRVVGLAGSNVVKALDIALFEKHGLQVLQGLEHLLTRLVSKATFFELLEQGSSSRTRSKASMPA